MAAKPLPSQETLRQLLDYNPDTGALTWRVRDARWFKDGARSAEITCAQWNTKYAGKEALNYPDPAGYRYGSLLGNHVCAHRVIWKWVTGEEPSEIDHDDGNGLNNRFKNLKSTSHQNNMHNLRLPKDNKSGTMGIYWYAKRGRWRVYIGHNGKRIFIGSFSTKEAAISARKQAEAMYGYHPNHGLRGA